MPESMTATPIPRPVTPSSPASPPLPHLVGADGFGRDAHQPLHRHVPGQMRGLLVIAHRIQRPFGDFEDRGAFEPLRDSRAVPRRQPLDPGVVSGDDDPNGAAAAGAEPVGQVAGQPGAARATRTGSLELEAAGRQQGDGDERRQQARRRQGR